MAQIVIEELTLQVVQVYATVQVKNGDIHGFHNNSACYLVLLQTRTTLALRLIWEEM